VDEGAAVLALSAAHLRLGGHPEAVPTEYKRFATVDKNWRSTLLAVKGGLGGVCAATGRPSRSAGT